MRRRKGDRTAANTIAIMLLLHGRSPSASACAACLRAAAAPAATATHAAVSPLAGLAAPPCRTGAPPPPPNAVLFDAFGAAGRGLGRLRRWLCGRLGWPLRFRTFPAAVGGCRPDAAAAPRVSAGAGPRACAPLRVAAPLRPVRRALVSDFRALVLGLGPRRQVLRDAGGRRLRDHLVAGRLVLRSGTGVAGLARRTGLRVARSHFAPFGAAGDLARLLALAGLAVQVVQVVALRLRRRDRALRRARVVDAGLWFRFQ